MVHKVKKWRSYGVFTFNFSMVNKDANAALLAHHGPTEKINKIDLITTQYIKVIKRTT